MLSKLASVSQDYIFGVQEDAGITDVSSATGISDISSLILSTFALIIYYQ